MKPNLPSLYKTFVDALQIWQHNNNNNNEIPHGSQ